MNNLFDTKKIDYYDNNFLNLLRNENKSVKDILKQYIIDNTWHLYGQKYVQSFTRFTDFCDDLTTKVDLPVGVIKAIYIRQFLYDNVQFNMLKLKNTPTELKERIKNYLNVSYGNMGDYK